MDVKLNVNIKRKLYVSIYCCLSLSSPVEIVSDIDDCASFPCGFDNECFDKVNGYTCSCTTGYAPDNTSTQCIGLSQFARCIGQIYVASFCYSKFNFNLM